MRHGIICMLLAISITAQSQEQKFPQGWIGNWKGDLLWNKGTARSQLVPMQLRIQATDSAHKFTWQIIYGSDAKDNRPYNLVAKDTAKGHWVIDENNGIVLDQFLIAGRFSGAFTVGNSTIINSYWMENGKLIVEFYAMAAKPVAKTGKGTEDSPAVDSYKVNAWQRAVLTRE